MRRVPFFMIFLVASLVTTTANAEDELQVNPQFRQGLLGLESAQLLDKGLASFKRGAFTLAVRSRIQAWGGWVGEEALLTNGDRMQEPGFRLRRARLGLTGEVFGQVEYELELDLFDHERTGGPLYEASIDWTPIHFIGVRAGVQKYPFMQSEMMSSAFLPHLDRPLGAFALSPPTSMGVVLHSSPWEDHLDIIVGAFNGLRRKTSFHEGYEGVGQTLGNRFEGLSYAARLDVMPLGPMDETTVPGEDRKVVVRTGLADRFQTEGLRLGLGGGFFYNDGSSIQTLGYSFYLHAKFYGVHVFAEYAGDQVKPQEDPTTTDTVLTEISRSVLNASIGYVPIENVFGVAVRFELLDDNADHDNEGDEWLITSTLNLYVLGDYLKAQLEYTHREEMHGVSMDNDAVLLGLQAAL